MGSYQSVFCRKEIKYLLDEGQYTALRRAFDVHLRPDAFAASSISNLYYDTPDHLLIRRSLEKPKYKEKLRLRCYNVPRADSEAFAEIKKKVGGVVYKRRTALPYGEALAFLSGRTEGKGDQVSREIAWMLRFYRELAPAVYLSYERESFRGIEDRGLRITFDRDILWRTEQLDLSRGPWGAPLLSGGQRLMEIKAEGALPLWLADTLSQNGVFPSSFSKYGRAYEALVRQGHPFQEVRYYA